MAYETTLGARNGLSEPPAETIRRNVSGFAHDVSTLADLQWKLLSLDLRESLQRLIVPLVLAAIGGVLLLAAIPVLLLGIGRLLAEYTELSTGGGFLVAALGAIILAAIFGGVAYVRLRGSFDVFERSRAELQRNFVWIKSALQSRHSTTNVHSA